MGLFVGAISRAALTMAELCTGRVHALTDEPQSGVVCLAWLMWCVRVRVLSARLQNNPLMVTPLSSRPPLDIADWGSHRVATGVLEDFAAEVR